MGLRNCSKCSQEKDETEFIKRCSENRKGKLSSWCKKCFSTNQMIVWNATKILVVKYLGDKCYKCKNQFHPALYDLHHRDPDKKSYDWKRLRRFSLKNILKEIQKCELVCSNCHRMNHINPDLWDEAVKLNNNEDWIGKRANLLQLPL